MGDKEEEMRGDSRMRRKTHRQTLGEITVHCRTLSIIIHLAHYSLVSLLLGQNSAYHLDFPYLNFFINIIDVFFAVHVGVLKPVSNFPAN